MLGVSEATKARKRAYGREYSRKYRQQNPEKVAAALKDWRAHNHIRVLEDKCLYRERHPKRVAAQLKRLREKNSEAYKLTKKLAYLDDPGPAKARASKRRAALLQRTPAWANLKAITQFFKDCPSGFEVDHVIPLQGKTVSGLHIVGNLQYLTRAVNRAKGNRLCL